MRWENDNNRGRLRRILRAIRAIKIWQLFVLLLLSGIITAIGFRLNNLGMMERVDAVTRADETGDPKALQERIEDLRRYVSTHMNTDLRGGIFLTHSYERVREAAMQSAQDPANPNSDAYRRASVECQTERFRVAGGYVQCVMNKVGSLPGQSNLASELKLPRSELYKINIVSPVWSPDLAGFSVLVSLVIVVVIVARITGVIVLRALLKKRFSSI